MVDWRKIALLTILNIVGCTSIENIDLNVKTIKEYEFQYNNNTQRIYL